MVYARYSVTSREEEEEEEEEEESRRVVSKVFFCGVENTAEVAGSTADVLSTYIDALTIRWEGFL